MSIINYNIVHMLLKGYINYYLLWMIDDYTQMSKFLESNDILKYYF